MILPDINLLVYAVDETNPFHESANGWWNECLSSQSTVALCYPSILGFVRLATNSNVFLSPMSVAEATGYIQEWTGQPNVTFALPTDRHWPILLDLLSSSGTEGRMTTDSHIAALAIEHGYTVFSNDADFGRFPTVSWVNPLD